MAIKTGWYDPQLNDKQNAQRLADTNFPTWLNKKSKQNLSNKIKITMATSTKGPDLSPYPEKACPYGETYCSVVVANLSSSDISGNEYAVYAQEKWTYGDNNINSPDYTGFVYTDKGSMKSLSGKPIPAYGTVTYSWKGNGWNSLCRDFQLSASIAFMPQAEKSNLSKMNFSGNEYSQYLAEKGK